MASRLVKGYFYPEDTLNRTCTVGCGEFLSQYEDSVASECGDQAWDNFFNADETGEKMQSVPVRIIPNLIRYLFSLTCLRDSGRFCNVIAGTAAMLADPGNTHFGWVPAIGNDTSVDMPDSCDPCFIKRLQMEAGSPYYEGPRLLSMGLYQSLTSSCGVTDMPLATSTLEFPTPTGLTPTPTASCSGEIYTIQPSDDCYSISQSQGIGTGWLLDGNKLGAWCSDFPTTGDLCIANTCNVHTVQVNETCSGIARRANITQAQLKAWNPIINTGCYNLDRMNGTTLCVSSPGRPYVAPGNQTTTGSGGSGPTAVPVPPDLANGTTAYCATYHEVQSGEYCNLLVLRYGISLEHFRILNPAINENCTNLYADESYCVQAVGDINTYPGQPGYTSVASTTTPAGPSTAFTLLPDATMAPYDRNDTSSPLAKSTRDDCVAYFEGSWFTNVTLPAGGSFGSVCALAARTYFAELDAFELWNPSLGNVTSPGCAFDPARRYCGQLYWDANGVAGQLPEGPRYEFEIREGYIEGCTRFDDVPLGWSCQDVFEYYGITVAQFYQYNPAVGPDCGNLWANYAYCTSIDPDPSEGDGEEPTSMTTRPPSTTTSAPTPTYTAPGQTQASQAPNCNSWVMAQAGDSCWAIADRTGITLEEFYTWNAVLGKDGTNCGTMIWPEYWYCISVAPA